ncbi:hypothetical protein NMY22_g10892 [Coprinellus aureogranulatus]|nr:hypothetical protein NMY22_g10892 [Coprinellus aureogranulatus]
MLRRPSTVKHAVNGAQMASPFMGSRPRLHSHPGNVGWPMVPVPMATPPMSLTPPMPMNGAMMPTFPNFGLQVPGHHLGVPNGAGMSPNLHSMTLPNGMRNSYHSANGTLPRPRSAAYDLAGEFGNLSVHSRSGSSGKEDEGGRGRHRCRGITLPLVPLDGMGSNGEGGGGKIQDDGHCRSTLIMFCTLYSEERKTRGTASSNTASPHTSPQSAHPATILILGLQHRPTWG